MGAHGWVPGSWKGPVGSGSIQGPSRHTVLGSGWVLGSWKGPVGSGWVHPRSKSAHGPRLWMGPRLMEGSCRLWVSPSKVQGGTRASALDGSSAHGWVLSALVRSIGSG